MIPRNSFPLSTVASSLQQCFGLMMNTCRRVCVSGKGGEGEGDGKEMDECISQ